jgi:outer membrane protein insertion porin family
LDESLLKNYYLNKGFKNVVIYSSYAKLINDDEFELIFNIDAKNKVFFNEIDIELPDDFEKNNYSEIYKFFDKIKNKPYSLSQIKKIVSKIELITLNEQFESVECVCK